MAYRFFESVKGLKNTKLTDPLKEGDIGGALVVEELTVRACQARLHRIPVLGAQPAQVLAAHNQLIIRKSAKRPLNV